MVVLLLLLWCSPPCCQPDHKKKEVLFCFLRNSSFTLRSRYQVYFHFLHHHQPLNHLRMEVNEFSNLSLFTLNVNSTSNVEVEKAERVEETTLHLEKTLAINQFAVQVIWDSEFRIFCNVIVLV